MFAVHVQDWTLKSRYNSETVKNSLEVRGTDPGKNLIRLAD